MVDTIAADEAGEFDITPASDHQDLPQVDLEEGTPEGTPEPQEGGQSPTGHQRKKDANRRAAIKSRQKKVAQADAQRVTLKAFEDDNEALRREIRVLMHASGALSGTQGGLDHDSQIRHDQIEDEYNLPSHSFSHGHPFGGHGGEGEGVEGLLGLGAGLGDLANVAAAADQTSGFLQYNNQQGQGSNAAESGKDTHVKRSSLATPTDLAVAALRKSIHAHRTALQSSPNLEKQQEFEAQIEAVKAATVQKDKELAVLHGVLRRMTLARQQTQLEVNSLREDLHQLIEDVGVTETGVGRQEKETDEVRRALREVRTYVETLVKQWKESGTLPPQPISVVPFLPPLPSLSGAAQFTHAHLGNIPIPSSLPKRRGRPPKTRPQPVLLPESLRHLMPLPDEVRARDDVVPLPKRRKLREDQMRGRPREFAHTRHEPSAATSDVDPANVAHDERPDDHAERQTLELLEGLAQSRHVDESHRPNSDHPLTLEQAAAVFGQGHAMEDMNLDELDAVISGRGAKRTAESMADSRAA